MPSRHSAPFANPRNALVTNCLRILLCAFIGVIGSAQLSVARAEPGKGNAYGHTKKGNAYGHAKDSRGNSGRQNDKAKVHSVPETVNSGLMLGMIGAVAVILHRFAKRENRVE